MELLIQNNTNYHSLTKLINESNSPNNEYLKREEKKRK